MKVIITCLALAVLFPLPGHCGDESGWELVRDDDGIKVYTRPVPDSKIKAFRGEALIPAGLNQIMALMDDMAACPDWMYRCEDPVLLLRNGVVERYSYMRNRLPWPARDRELIVRSLIEQDADTRAVVITLTGVVEEDLPESARTRLPQTQGHVRVNRLNGSWTFRPQQDSGTYAVYEMHAEIAGNLPAAMVNSQIIDTPFETLARMREVVLRERYRCFQPF
jgi:hypothetical protein